MPRHLFTAIVSFTLTAQLCAADLEVHFINVGQGDSTLIQTPNGRNILVDCGSLGGGDRNAIRDYLLGQLGPQPKLDVLVITHADRDHFNLITFVLDSVDVRKVLLTGSAGSYSNRLDDWLRRRIPTSRKILLGRTDFDIEDEPSDLFGQGRTKFHVLAANIRSSFSASNAKSIVLMVTLDDFDVLLTGDATRDTERVIIDRYDDDWLDVEVLKIGHHGSLRTSTTQAWADVTKPELAVVSCAYSNSYGHPRKEVFNRLEPYTEDLADGHRSRWFLDPDGPGGQPRRPHTVTGYKEAIYTTARNGTVVVTSDGDTYDVTYGGAVTHRFGRP